MTDRIDRDAAASDATSQLNYGNATEADDVYRLESRRLGVYRKSKVSNSPGPRATNVVGSRKGDSYTYIVDKFWVVQELLPDGELRMRTARGKTHVIRLDDPSLRRPSLVQRLIWRNRFRLIEESASQANLQTD